MRGFIVDRFKSQKLRRGEDDPGVGAVDTGNGEEDCPPESVTDAGDTRWASSGHEGCVAGFDRLAVEHRTLIGRYGEVQSRCSAMLAAQAAEIQRLKSEIMCLRGHVIARDSALAFAREDRAALEASIPGLPRRLTLMRRVEALMMRVQELMRDRARTAQPAKQLVAPGSMAALADVRRKAVLCIGADDCDAGVARRMIEMAGGRFLHRRIEDVEDNAALEASLVAADLVICQTGCVAHNAYWRVQDHCRRTGKQCVLVDQPQVLRLIRQVEPETVSSPEA